MYFSDILSVSTLSWSGIDLHIEVLTTQMRQMGAVLEYTMLQVASQGLDAEDCNLDTAIRRPIEKVYRRKDPPTSSGLAKVLPKRN